MPDDFASVQRFCLTLCCARTGGTLLAALLDAHPHMVFANEVRAPVRIQDGLARAELFALLLEQSRSHARAGKEWTGYRYQVSGQFQGSARRLEVLGDKSGVVPALLLQVQPTLLDQVRETVGVRVQIIHNVRNPFDAVGTMARRSGASLRNRAGVFFSVCEAMVALRERCAPEDFMTTRHEDLLAHPAGELGRLCSFLGQEAEPGYLNACSALVTPRPHASRFEHEWPRELLDYMTRRCADYDFLAGYQFEA